MTISRSRHYTYKDPNLPAVRNWLTNKYSYESSNANTNLELERVSYRFKDIPDEYIWVEYVLTPTDLSGEFLACISVTRRGYAVLDARLTFTSLAEVIDYFNLTVIEVDNYASLFNKIKESPVRVLYKVKSGSGKYGVIVDNRLTKQQRYNEVITALGGVNFNVAINYTGETISLSSPNVGEVALSWPGFISTTLEVYPLEEIEQIK